MLGDLAHKFWDFSPASVGSRSVQSCYVAACLVKVSELEVLSLHLELDMHISYTHSGDVLV
jgi:hypothetical protein